MAGVKITDLGTLNAPVSADLLYIVDVSDTSQSPQGTSKQIELGNVLDFESGTFTPAYDDLVRITSPVLAYTGAWTRIGENISFGVQLTGDLSFAETSGSFTITLPEIINNFDGNNTSFIIGTYDNVTGNEKAIIYPNIGALTATIEIEGYTAASTFNLFVNAIYKR